MSEAEETVVAAITPSGRGAVATVVVAGPDALHAVESQFLPAGPQLRGRAIGDIAYGRWGSPAGEDLVVSRVAQTTIEIHCHGGPTASARIQSDLVTAGCRAISWQQWICRRSNDGIQAAAEAALAEARTARTAAILLDQHQGALRGELLAIVSELEGDYGSAATMRLARLLEHAKIGLHLVRPWRVVLAGPPNVGKSSLINLLLGYERSIVFNEPGTTRDVVTAATAVDGWPVELADTAGLRAGRDELETEGVERARQQLGHANLVVLVFDASQPWRDECQSIYSATSLALIVHNKADLPIHPDVRPKGLLVSAKTGLGLGAVLDEISRRLVPHPPAIRAAIPFTQFQVEAVANAAALVSAGKLASAAVELRRCLTGG